MASATYGLLSNFLFPWFLEPLHHLPQVRLYLVELELQVQN